MTLGLPHGQNYLVPHDEEWATVFEEERARVRRVLPAEAMDIQHVGSTAVSGIQAKPIIDIAVAATTYAIAGDWQDRMASIGYDYPGDIGISEHRIYGRDRTVRYFLVHVVDADGRRWRDFIRFRNRLRDDRSLAMEYEAVKLSAAAENPTGRDRYTRSKASFIDAVLLARAATHALVTPTTIIEWDSYHRIRREVLFEARGQFGVYNADHPHDRAPGNHPKLLVYGGDHVGVVRVDIVGPVAAIRRVAIRADVQRRGHGRALLDLVQRFAGEAGCTELVSNVVPDAVAFYEAFGFVVEQKSAAGAFGRESVYMTKAVPNGGLHQHDQLGNAISG